MEPSLHYRAMEAFCRQRSKMDGEDERFWLVEADLWNRLATNAHRTKVLRARKPNIAYRQKERPPNLGA